MNRRLEIFEATGIASRFTITPERVTIKFLDENDVPTFKKIAAAVEAKIRSDKSLRGSFDMDKKILKLSLKRGPVMYTFNFDGEMIGESA